MADIIEVNGNYFNMDKFVMANEGDAGMLWVQWRGGNGKKAYSGEIATGLLAALKERSK